MTDDEQTTRNQRNAYYREYYANNKDKYKAKYQRRKELRKLESVVVSPEKRKEDNKRYYEKTKERRKAQYESNKDDIKQKQASYYRKRRDELNANRALVQGVMNLITNTPGDSINKSSIMDAMSV